MILPISLVMFRETDYLRGRSTFDEVTNDPHWISSTSQSEQILDTEVEPEYDGSRSHTDSYTGEEDGQGEALVDTNRSVCGQ